MVDDWLAVFVSFVGCIMLAVAIAMAYGGEL